jgi:hypothetical protein
MTNNRFILSTFLLSTLSTITSADISTSAFTDLKNIDSEIVNTSPDKISDNGEPTETNQDLQATPKASLNDDGNIQPSITASYQTGFNWVNVSYKTINDPNDSSKKILYKDVNGNAIVDKIADPYMRTKFTAEITVNSSLETNDDTQEMVQDYYQQGGNTDFTLLYGMSWFGKKANFWTVSFLANYSKIDTQELDDLGTLVDLDTEVGSLGLITSINLENNFFLSYQGRRNHILGSDGKTSLFESAIDNQWSNKIGVAMRLDEPTSDGNMFIQLSRSYGGGATDPELQVTFTKTYKNIFDIGG